MKRLFLAFLTVLVLAIQAQASSLIVYGGNLSDDDKIAIDALLREYTGPAAAHFIQNPSAVNDPQFALLFSDEPFAEEKFMRNMLQNKYPGVRVEAIPTTLWDTTVARLWLTDKSIHEKYTEIGSVQGTRRVKKEHKLRYFDIAAEIGQKIEGEGQKHDKFKAMIIENLRLIKENRLPDVKVEWSASLIHEYDNIMAGKSSLLLELVDEEYQAAKHNKFMVIRATGGAKMSVPPDFSPLEAEQIEEVNKARKRGVSEDNIQKAFGDLLKGLSESKVKMRKNNEGKWQYNDHDTRRVIDFQTVGMGAAVFDNIAALEKKIENPEMQLYDLNSFSTYFSYATSLMGGFLYDSFNRSLSACSFVYYARGQTNIVYTLMLDKKWTFEQGRKAFYFMKDGLYTDAIFGSQEAFHPRMLSIVPIAADDDYDIGDSYQGVKTTEIGLDSNFPYGEFDIRTENDPLMSTATIVLQQLIRNSELLTHARVVALGKQVFKTPNETPEAQELIANQKVAFDTLLEHIRR